MLRSLRRYILIIALILILPTLIFSVYEIGTLRQNEKAIEDIYKNQLETIFFSIDEYSDAVLKEWAGQLESCLLGDTASQGNCLDMKLAQMPAASGLFLYRPDSGSLTDMGPAGNDNVYPKELRRVLRDEKLLFEKLPRYWDQVQYRQIETLKVNPQMIYLLFYAETIKEGVFVILVLDPQRFIDEALGNRIQELARNKFYITAQKSGSETIVYISDPELASGNKNRIKPEYRQDFDLIPGYSLGIKLKDTSISDLARSHSRRNLFLIILIDLVLFFGMWLIYRNVKKQVELAQLKSDFVSNVSHEIRTPLALINMYIETLEMGRIRTREKISEYYKVIMQETQRLTSIVNKILCFSHIESGKRSYVMESIDLNEIVTDVTESYSIRLQKDGFSVNMSLQPEIPSLHADKEAITDALINLIDNAIKYSDKDKYIEISTRLKGADLILSVEDHGIGISQEDQKHIFDKFFRVTEKDLAFKSKGSGLGLTIVRHIIDAHKGKITLDSKKGRGSRFELHFPIQSDKIIKHD